MVDLIKTATCIFWAVEREFLSWQHHACNQSKLTVLAHYAPKKPGLHHGTIIALLADESVCDLAAELAGPTRNRSIANTAFAIVRMEQKVEFFLRNEAMSLPPPSTEGARRREPDPVFCCNTGMLCVISMSLNVSGRLYSK